MNIELELLGQNANEMMINDFQDWIRREHIDELATISRISTKPNDEEMGVEPELIISIVLGSAAIVELVKSIVNKATFTENQQI